MMLGCCSSQVWVGVALDFSLQQTGFRRLQSLWGGQYVGIAENADFRASCRQACADAHNTTVGHIEVIDVRQESFNTYKLSYAVLVGDMGDADEGDNVIPPAAIDSSSNFTQIFASTLVEVEAERPGGVQGIGIEVTDLKVAQSATSTDESIETSSAHSAVLSQVAGVLATTQWLMHRR